MKHDRKIICKIISKMLDNPNDDRAIDAYDTLERYINMARAHAVGWTHGKCCGVLDNGNDPRELEVQELWEEAQKSLSESGIDAFMGEGDE